MSVDYNRMADIYARNRRAGLHVLVELQSFYPMTAASKVLEVGCGTADHVHALVGATGCAGWGVEPSEEMRRHAPPDPRLTVCPGTADVTGFEDAFFDLLFSVNVIHHVPDAERHFVESFRVLRPGGWICTFTDSADIIRRREPLSKYWPSSAAADMARYPPVEALLRSMGQTGFIDLACREIKQASQVTDARPYREKAYSCLRLIGEREFQEGLVRLENDLRQGPVAGVSEYACLWGRKPS